MKTFLIVIGCILLYIFMIFVTLVLGLYCDRCELGTSDVYGYAVSDNFVASLFWPISIWLVLGYLLYLKLKKYAIAITEVLYQTTHKEDESEEI